MQRDARAWLGEDGANRLAAAEGLVGEVGREPERVVLGDDGIRQPLRVGGRGGGENQRERTEDFPHTATLPEWTDLKVGPTALGPS